MKSVFSNKDQQPTTNDLKNALGEPFIIWNQLEAFTKNNYPEAISDWNFSGEKFGWSYRIKDKKRVILYLLPRDKYFKAALVFGQKAVGQILDSSISETIKTDLMAAKAYAEGRGIRIEVRDASNLEDIKKLIQFKIMN
ncbi:MAG: DUF3788 domain-containing protein [Flavobacterium sp. JAD_PAG50586_2]|nr:MAG: DUF3788 domain-containing protein [Flavobacterium sp. JAD_PAG50586_2]